MAVQSNTVGMCDCLLLDDVYYGILMWNLLHRTTVTLLTKTDQLSVALHHCWKKLRQNGFQTVQAGHVIAAVPVPAAASVHGLAA